MMIHASSTVGELATDYPLATRVFARHGIDFCCGGGKSLQEVCSSRGLSSSQLVEEIERELQQTPGQETDWKHGDLSELIDHILEVYHEPLRSELPRLEQMASKVLRVHGNKAPEQLQGVLDTLLSLRDELESHMLKEEQILFPLIQQGRGAHAGPPIRVMEAEHISAGEDLSRLRTLTNDFQFPQGACNTWRALWSGLEDLERSLHQHIHLENNILFPRALTE